MNNHDFELSNIEDYAVKNFNIEPKVARIYQYFL